MCIVLIWNSVYAAECYPLTHRGPPPFNFVLDLSLIDLL